MGCRVRVNNSFGFRLKLLTDDEGVEAFGFGGFTPETLAFAEDSHGSSRRGQVVGSDLQVEQGLQHELFDASLELLFEGHVLVRLNQSAAGNFKIAMH